MKKFDKEYLFRYSIFKKIKEKYNCQIDLKTTIDGSCLYSFVDPNGKIIYEDLTFKQIATLHNLKKL